MKSAVLAAVMAVSASFLSTASNATIHCMMKCLLLLLLTLNKAALVAAAAAVSLTCMYKASLDAAVHSQ
jgi:hypothetical protein